MNQRGTSLLEVIVTTVLLGMLAGVATLSIGQYLNNGKKKIAESDIKTLVAATRLYLLDHSFPSGAFDASSALVPEYLPELPADPFAADRTGSYGFALTTYNSRPAIRIYSNGPGGESGGAICAMKRVTGMKINQSEAGLTFFELIITVLILATLASIAMLNFSQLQQDAVRELARTDLKVIRAALRSYYLDHEAFPAALSQLVDAQLMDALPDDKFLDGSGTKYHYQVISPSSGILWSVGPDRVDNTGSGDDESLQFFP